jgi:hypothetical protein
VRAGQESAEAIVVKRAGESRQERRAEEPRDQPQNSGKERSEKSSETDLERQLKVTSRIGLEGKREWNSLANQQTGGEPAARRTRCTKDLQRFNRRMRKTARPAPQRWFLAGTMKAPTRLAPKVDAAPLWSLNRSAAASSLS